MPEALAPVIARLLLRYVGSFVAGVATANSLINDPDIVSMVSIAVGAVMSAIAEAWMIYSRRQRGEK